MTMENYDSGATRTSSEGRLDPEAFLNPLVLERYCLFMHKHRMQADGKLRDGDNWQKGIPRKRIAKGMWRHFLHFWTRHRELPVMDAGAEADIEEDLCAIIFGANCYLWEIIRERLAKEPEVDNTGDYVPRPEPWVRWQEPKDEAIPFSAVGPIGQRIRNIGALDGTDF